MTWGADGWLRKPCREAELLQEIGRLTGVQYRHVSPHVRSLSPAQPMLAVRLAPPEPFPPALARGLRHAAHIADYQRVNELLECAPPSQAAVAADLHRLLEGYAYDEIERRMAILDEGPIA